MIFSLFDFFLLSLPFFLSFSLSFFLLFSHSMKESEREKESATLFNKKFLDSVSVLNCEFVPLDTLF